MSEMVWRRQTLHQSLLGSTDIERVVRVPAMLGEDDTRKALTHGYGCMSTQLPQCQHNSLSVSTTPSVSTQLPQCQHNSLSVNTTPSVSVDQDPFPTLRLVKGPVRETCVTTINWERQQQMLCCVRKK